MPDQTALERSYRRLLWVYPRFYRRERGLEMLTTLLDASPPGQVRASGSEAMHLVLAGLRCRLVPPGWAGKVAAGVATLWVAIVLSGVGAYAAWAPTDRPDPAEARLAALIDAMVGRPASQVLSATDDPLDMAYSYKSASDLQMLAVEGWDGALPVPAASTRVYPMVAGTPSGSMVVRDARGRLQADGWRTGTIVHLPNCSCDVLWAQRDGHLLRVTGGEDRYLPIMIGLYRIEPGGVRAGAVGGLVGGLIGSWLVMTWLAQRFVRTPGRDRLLVLLFGLPALTACVVNTVDTVLSMAPDPEGRSVVLAADFMYPLANQVANPLASGLVALGLAASIAVMASAPVWTRPFVGDREPDASQRPPRPTVAA